MASKSSNAEMTGDDEDDSSVGFSGISHAIARRGGVVESTSRRGLSGLTESALDDARARGGEVVGCGGDVVG